MKITDVQIDGFGVWTGLEITNLSHRVTLFYGPNEAGKTTLMQFVRTVLYGLPAGRAKRYLPPVHGGRPGGTLGALVPHGAFTILRRLSDDEENGQGKVELLGSDGRRRSTEELDHLLSGIDEAIFNNVFAVGLRELQELGTLNDTEAADQLYKLTTGLDRVSLVDVMRELVSGRQLLQGDTRRPGRLSQLIEQRETLCREIDDLSQRSGRWALLCRQSAQLKQEVQQLEQAIADIQLQSRLTETALQARPPWLECQKLDQQIEDLGPLPPLPGGIVEQVEDTNHRITRRRERAGQLKRQIEQVRSEGQALSMHRGLWAQRARIEALCELRPWIASLEDQIERLEPEVAELESELQIQFEQSGLPSGVKYSELPEVSRRGLSSLRGPARRIRIEQRRLKQVQGEKESSCRESDEIEETLLNELAELGHEDLDSAMQTVGERANQLRRRIQVQERIEKLQRSREELEEQRKELLEAQVLPPKQLGLLSIPFVAGCTLLLAGLIWPVAGTFGMFLSALGLAGLIAAIVMKFVMERNAREELEDCQRQLNVLQEQMKKLRQQRDELDAQLPAGGGPFEVRLKAADAELARLEELMPLEAERKTTRQRLEATDQRREKANQALREAHQGWKKALKAANLPENLTPKHIRELSQGYERIAHSQQQLEMRRDELRQRRRELEEISERIGNLVAELNVDVEPHDPQSQLRALAAGLAEQRQLAERRRALKKQFHELKHQQARCQRVGERLHQHRCTLLTSVGVTDERQLYQAVQQRERHQQLVENRAAADAQLAAAIGPLVSRQQVLELLEETSSEGLNRRWQDLTSQLQQQQTRLSELHQRRGELNHEMKVLADDRRLDYAKLELDCLERQIEQAAGRWRQLALTELLLESVREIYEQQRQPDTLQTASRYLDQLTEGQYRRVWTPLGSDTLNVDTRDGDALPVEVLSRGTREAVFFSLRLALVVSYARRGAHVPLILDDILVNFDARRARSAVEVLRDFAQSGHQILMFTCHEHIVRLFRDVQIEVRMLPDHTNLQTSHRLEADFDDSDRWEEPAEQAWQPQLPDEEAEEEGVWDAEEDELEVEVFEEDALDEEDQQEEDFDESSLDEETDEETDEESDLEPDSEELDEIEAEILDEPHGASEFHEHLFDDLEMEEPSELDSSGQKFTWEPPARWAGRWEDAR